MAKFLHQFNLLIPSGQTSLPEKPTLSNVQLESATIERLKQLQEKGIDIDQLINEFLDRREREISETKTKISAEIETTTDGQPASRVYSRYIPARIRHILRQEHGTKCSIPHCPRPATAIHHTRRFALSPAHDPHYLAPLCREHHQIAHGIDAKHLGFMTLRR